MSNFEEKSFDEKQLYGELVNIRSLELPLREDSLLNAFLKEYVIDSKRFLENYPDSADMRKLSQYLSEISDVSNILKSLGKSSGKLRYSVKKEQITEMINYKEKSCAARDKELLELLGPESADLFIKEFNEFADKLVANKKSSCEVILNYAHLQKIAGNSKIKPVKIGSALGILSKEDWLAPLVSEIAPFTEKTTYSPKYLIDIHNAMAIREFRDYRDRIKKKALQPPETT